MSVIYLGVYTLVLALLWWLFIVAKIHAYKFKNFSTDISKVTNILLIFLIILSILGYILIIFFTNDTSITVKNYDSLDVKEINY